MTEYQKLSIIFSVFALFISIIGLIISCIANHKSNKTQMGSLESQLRSAISSARKSFSEFSLIIAQKKEKDTIEGEKEIYKKILKERHEDSLNAYEEACAKYIDGKIDKVRFKKSYCGEIRNLVQNKTNGEEKYFDSTTSPYKAILKVYKEWNDLEK